MRINIETIPHSEQRYETVGDWWFDKEDSLEIRVSDMKNWKYESLIAIHELAEVLLCKDRGISEESVSNFDKHYGMYQPEGSAIEPGDDINAPYRKEHFFATNIERLMSEQLGVDWLLYDKTVNEL